MYSNIYNIIVAAGSGSRFGSELPKQFCTFLGRPLVMTTVERFREALPDSHIILVISPHDAELWQDLCRKYSFESPATVFGGATRWESVRNAIHAIPGQPDEDAIITVHDGARPMSMPSLIRRVVKRVRDGADGAIPATEVTESLRIVIGPDGESSPVDRSQYRAVQTPQAFRARALREAYRLPYTPEFTDDASVMAAAGFTGMKLVDGDPINIKVTHPNDIKVAELYNESIAGT